MNERGIIIADKDTQFRQQMSDVFKEAGYRVETTDSSVHVLCNILEKQTPVVLLGSDFDKKVPPADLIHLLKKCHRHLSVILVSEDSSLSLPMARQIRQEGVFYHALKPLEAGDTEELKLAVKCAFDKYQRDIQSDFSYAPLSVCLESVVEPEPVKESFMKTIIFITCMAALIFGATYFSLEAIENMKRGSNLAIWIFLGFCGMILVSQLLPIFRTRLSVEKVGKLQQAEELSKGADHGSK